MTPRKTARLILRSYQGSDLERLAEIRAEVEYMRYMMWPTSIDEQAKLFDHHVANESRFGFGPWTIVSKESGEVIGWGGINHVPDAQEDYYPQLTYFIDSKYAGLGLTSELVVAALTYGFDECNLPVIAAIAHPDNAPSNHIPRKNGFTYVDYLEDYDRNYYEQTKAHWLERCIT